MYLSDKVIVVTGGSGLLGSEFCRAIINNNGNVIVADINKVAADKLVSDLNSGMLTPRAFSYYVNINQKSTVEELLTELDIKFGKVDALVNNAYPRNENYGRDFYDVTYEDFCENLNLNMGGYFITSQLFSKYFLKQGHGNIINIASIYGVTAPKFDIYEGTSMTMPVEYAVIKSGLLHFTKYLAKYLKGKNIRVNALSPGGIRDKQTERFKNNYKSICLNKGMLEPKDISGTLVYLLSDSSLFINGQNIIVDDGFTL